MMIDEKKKAIAVSEFCKNPTWRNYYETAPSQASKEFIEMEFYHSFYFGDKSLDEVYAIQDRAESKFDIDDWKHQLKYAGNNPWRAICKQKIRELEEKHGGYKENDKEMIQLSEKKTEEILVGEGQKFERIRRITGYLVGTMDRWNDAKRAEEHDRVKHGL